MSRKVLILCIGLVAFIQVNAQKTSSYYSDQNYLDQVKRRTPYKRDFYIFPDSIVSKTYYKDSLQTEGIYYGFENPKEIAPFEVYYRSQKLIRLNNLKLDDRRATITTYEKNQKVQLAKFEDETALILQRWVDGLPRLESGFGLIETKSGNTIFLEEYRNYVRSKSYSIRTETQDTLYAQLDKAAIPPGGDIYGFQKEVKAIFEYPKKAKRKGLQPIVHLTFVVDKDGSITELSVLNSDAIDPMFTELIEKGLDLLSKWEPAYFDGKPVKTKYQVKLQYILK